MYKSIRKKHDVSQQKSASFSQNETGSNQSTLNYNQSCAIESCVSSNYAKGIGRFLTFEKLITYAKFSFLAILTLSVLMPDLYAGTGGDELEDLADEIESWITGYVGLTIILVGTLYGVIALAIKGQFMGLAAVIGAALFLTLGLPGILGMVTALI